MRKLVLYIGDGLCVLSCQKEKKWHTDVQLILQPDQVANYEKDLDHAGIHEELDQNSFKRGGKTYQTVRHNCHGNIVDEGLCQLLINSGS